MKVVTNSMLPSSAEPGKNAGNDSKERFFDGSGPIYVVGDDVSADAIIGPEYWSFDLTRPDERKILAGYVFASVEDQFGRFVEPDESLSRYRIILAGKTFGHGSARLHSVVALAEAGVRVIVAESFGDGFFRSCVNDGGVLPLVLRGGWRDRLGGIKNGMAGMVDLKTRKISVDGKGIDVFEDPGVVPEIVLAGGLLRCCGELQSNRGR